jgi:large subunit ribosomal protein L35
MPKMKTNSSAKKRFTVTGSGKIKRAKAYKRHILTKKTTEQKRRLTKAGFVDKTDLFNVKKMLVLCRPFDVKS